MPGLLDFTLLALLAVAWPLYTHLVGWPKHVKRVAAGDPGARIRMYRQTLVEEWAFAAAVAALWIAFARPLEALALPLPSGWRLLIGAALPMTYAALLVAQVPAIARNAAARARIRLRLTALKPLIPHRAEEWRWFVGLSVSAGICEELLFRGFIVWALTPAVGLYAAAAVSATAFGLGHFYQGNQFGMKASIVGVGLGILALVTGSIIPGMVLHALIDLGSGYITYLAMREPEPNGDPVMA